MARILKSFSSVFLLTIHFVAYFFSERSHELFFQEKRNTIFIVCVSFEGPVVLTEKFMTDE